MVWLALALSLQDPVAPPEAPPEKGLTEESKTGKVLAFEKEQPVRVVGRPLREAQGLGWTIFWTLFTLTALGVVLWFIRKFVRNSKFIGGGGVVDIVACKGLENGAKLYVVEIGRTMFLIGHTKDRLSSLGTLRDPEELAMVRGKKPAAKVFERSLEREIRASEADDEAQTMDDVLGQIRDLRRNVRDMREKP